MSISTKHTWLRRLIRAVVPLIAAVMLAHTAPLSAEAQVPAPYPYWYPTRIIGIGLVIPGAGDGAGRGAGDGRSEVPSHSVAVGTAVSEVPSFVLALPE